MAPARRIYDMPQSNTEPELTLPQAEADWVCEAYAQAGTILEYGSGGSTMLAARMPGKTVFSVENDPDWAHMMTARLDAAETVSEVHIHHVDIGPTGKWGRPRDRSKSRRYADYHLSVFDRADFSHPDLVLIDGRFRAACLFALMMRLSRPTPVLFDDYRDRPTYRVVERILEPSEIRGRMPRFDVTPAPWPSETLSTIIRAFHDPR